LGVFRVKKSVTRRIDPARCVGPRFLAVGFSKFVLRPVGSPASWRAELEALSAAVGNLQT
jgi:hypothetical protein